MTVPTRVLAGSVVLALLGASAAHLRAEGPWKPPATPPQASSPALPGLVMARGGFRPAETPVSGSFVIRKEGARQVLVLSSDFSTNDRAPDLKVVFSPSSSPLASSRPPAYPLRSGSYVILAPLTSASGEQRYVIPGSIDLSRQGSVLIWCEKFNATMAWAPLRP